MEWTEDKIQEYVEAQYDVKIYAALYLGLVADGWSCRLAYGIVEERIHLLTGRYRYKNIGSFRSACNYYKINIKTHERGRKPKQRRTYR